MTQGGVGPTLDVPVLNYLYDSNQALLDIDLIFGLGGGFTYLSGLQSGVGATTATLKFVFDGAGAAVGVHTRNVTVSVSDENIPGATTSLLQLTLSVTVNAAGNPADLDGNGTVDGADLAILLGQWGASGNADINGDGVVNGADLALLLGAWS